MTHATCHFGCNSYAMVVVEKKASKKCKKNDGTAEFVSKEKKVGKKKVKTPEEIAEEDTFAKELFNVMRFSEIFASNPSVD
ncbi:hypothetical protein BBJ29_007658 [Phytophthora kernoviae]|uniref:Uncharacterized protein n=1 Tax=Phytophthora kernoviae TaxID=325452 RepID=A0A3F2RN93_9STRA|nr:hypothetical protein BBJ29_007658 [Phytophthora kernoviae]RLN60890.1 hypothetical protein BBP00_00005705 [Phytophthora kernoviae]